MVSVSCRFSGWSVSWLGGFFGGLDGFGGGVGGGVGALEVGVAGEGVAGLAVDEEADLGDLRGGRRGGFR